MSWREEVESEGERRGEESITAGEWTTSTAEVDAGLLFCFLQITLTLHALKHIDRASHFVRS